MTGLMRGGWTPASGFLDVKCIWSACPEFEVARQVPWTSIYTDVAPGVLGKLPLYCEACGTEMLIRLPYKTVQQESAEWLRQ